MKSVVELMKVNVPTAALGLYLYKLQNYVLAYLTLHVQNVRNRIDPLEIVFIRILSYWCLIFCGAPQLLRRF